MWIYFDESGDEGFKFNAGSGEHYIVAAVVFYDETQRLACENGLTLLREELGLPRNVPFHFKSDNPTIRNAFVRRACESTFDAAIVSARKREVDQTAFKARNSMHLNAVETLCKTIRSWIPSDCRKIIVEHDSKGGSFLEDRIRKVSRKALKTADRRRQITVRVSRSGNRLIQLADAIASGTFQAEFNGHRQYFELFKQKIRERPKWPSADFRI